MDAYKNTQKAHLSTAAHILLHGERGGGGLGVQAPGIEAHALPDKRHLHTKDPRGARKKNKKSDIFTIFEVQTGGEYSQTK